ncbi:MAG: hypothetical protein J1E65_06180 [Lachnospiraceae bacterium]|nr:hypothetical protein [Lachnospiraceae bacterium]
MKKFFLLLILGLSLFMVGGCADVPDEVRKNIDTYRGGDDAKASEDSSFTYLPLSELEENAASALQKEYGQFRLADNIVCSIPEEISLVTLQYLYQKDLEDHYMDAFSLFFTQQEIDAQKIERGYSQTDDDFINYYFKNEEEQLYGECGNDGYLAIYKPDAYEVRFANINCPNVKIYHVDRNDDLSDEYRLKDGECTVAEAVDYINDWLETEYKQFEPDYDYKVKTVIVREYGEVYFFEITAEAFYHGVPLDSFTSEFFFDEDVIRMYQTYTYSRVDIQMMNVCRIDSIQNAYGILEPVQTEPADAFISLESALQYCEKTFTDFRDITISDIGIKYTLSPVYDYIGVEVPVENGIIIYSHPAYGPGIEVVSRPVWEFIIDVDPAEFLQRDENGELEPNPYGDMRRYIYIDMLSGELHFKMDVDLY